MRTIIALPADTHCGSSMGLMPVDGFITHDGQEIKPSPLQKDIWAQWAEAWGRVAELRKRSRLIVVHCGDTCEGVHHNSTQMPSTRVDEHEEMFIECFDWALRKAKFNPEKGDQYYQIAGTEEHSGSGSQSEEMVAKDFDAVPQYIDKENEKRNRWTWDRLRLNINGVLLDIAHHGGSVGRRAWTTKNGLRHTLMSLYFECLNYKQPIPRYWIRAHKHKHVEAYYQDEQAEITGVVCPSFQFKTGYAYKISATNISDIGMMIIVVEDNGQSWHKCIKLTISQDKVMKV